MARYFATADHVGQSSSEQGIGSLFLEIASERARIEGISISSRSIRDIPKRAAQCNTAPHVDIRAHWFSNRKQATVDKLSALEQHRAGGHGIAAAGERKRKVVVDALRWNGERNRRAP